MRIGTISRCYILYFIILVLSGCSIEQPPSPTPDHQDFGSPGSNIPQKETVHSKTFGILYPVAQPFYEMITEQMEETAEDKDIQLTVKAPTESNVEQQILMMENMIKQQVDGIAISPIDPVAMAPLVNKAVQQGIPVICFETDIPNSQRLTYIGADPYQEGHLMGSIVNRELKGKGMIMVQGGLPSSPRERSRLNGMLDHLKTSKIQVLDIRYNEGISDNAIANLEQMIDDHPHFDALVSMDIISSSSSILVWKAQGLKRIALSYGLTPEVKEALVNGQINSAISENEELLGGIIIEQLFQASKGASLPAWIDTGIQEVSHPVLN